MSVVRWTFTDVSHATPTPYVFEVNPSADGAPAYKKNLQYVNTTAPGGKVLIFEGQDQAPTITFTGTILSQTQHDSFVSWFNTRRQIQLTDDLGNTWMIYISEYTPKRERSFQYPWKRSYTVVATILDWLTA